ncbi:MAG: hypothetical protein ACE5FI_13810 [Anaerolineales bacterium]
MEDRTRIAENRVAHVRRLLRLWLVLPLLAVASPAVLRQHGVPTPSDVQRFHLHINRVTWMFGLSLIAGLTLLGHGAWGWQMALAVAAVLASNGYNRHQFQLSGKQPVFALAAGLALLGLIEALGQPALVLPASVAALLPFAAADIISLVRRVM